MIIVIIAFMCVWLFFIGDLMKIVYRSRQRHKIWKQRDNQNYSHNKLGDFCKYGLTYRKNENGTYTVTKLPEINLYSEFSHVEFIDKYNILCDNEREYEKQKFIDDRDDKIESILNQ